MQVHIPYVYANKLLCKIETMTAPNFN